jgi:hypothetical protein
MLVLLDYGSINIVLESCDEIRNIKESASLVNIRG